MHRGFRLRTGPAGLRRGLPNPPGLRVRLRRRERAASLTSRLCRPLPFSTASCATARPPVVAFLPVGTLGVPAEHGEGLRAALAQGRRRHQGQGDPRTSAAAPPRLRGGARALRHRPGRGGCSHSARDDELGFDPLALGPPPMPERARRLDWASLLERVFFGGHSAARLLRGSRKVTAFIRSGRLAREILERLGVDATGPSIAKARARPHQEHFDLHPREYGRGSEVPGLSRLRAGLWGSYHSLAVASVGPMSTTGVV
jgi:hypothetical protein